MAQGVLGFSPIEVPQSLILVAIRGVTQRCLSEVEDFTEIFSVAGPEYLILHSEVSPVMLRKSLMYSSGIPDPEP
jgi:hypothetical protein